MTFPLSCASLNSVMISPGCFLCAKLLWCWPFRNVTCTLNDPPGQQWSSESLQFWGVMIRVPNLWLPPVNKTSTSMGSHWATQKNAIYGEIQSSASLESSWSPLHAEKTTWQRPKDLGTMPLRPHIFLKPLLRLGTLTKRGSQHHVGGCNMMQYVPPGSMG